MCERSWFTYLRQQGWDLADKEKEGIYLTVKKVEADYLSPARYGTMVEIKTEIQHVTRASFWFHHLIRDHYTQTPLAEVRTQMVVINSLRKILRLPPELKNILRKET